jgi:glycerol-3-phosphate dehydrogenase
VHADELRLKDQPDLTPRIVPSRGTHLIFKKGLLKDNQGIIIPETTDGRLLFVINYMGHPMVGTTDEFCDATHNCEPSEKEIDFIIDEIKPFLGRDYDYKANLLSAWAGQRPLVKSCPSDVFVDDSKQPRWRDSVSSFF